MTTISKLKTELSELEIKSAGLKKDAAIVNDAVVNIKLEISRKMADIINAKNEENEPSAAEKWLESVDTSTPGDWMNGDMIAAHEAGQKHQAGVERERVRPLVEALMKYHKDLDETSCAESGTVRESLADYQRGWTITGPDLELPEKPSWAEPEPETKKEKFDKVLLYLEASKSDHLTFQEIEQVKFIFRVVNLMNETPIKD